MTTATLGALVRSVASNLGSTAEARWIVAGAAGVDDNALMARLEEPVAPAVQRHAHDMARRVQSGEPLQYVLGCWAFREIEVHSDARALVPRPETEQVVGFALEELHRIHRAAGRPLVAADLGTGSGVIALSLATEGPADLEVWATDRSRVALDLFEENAAALAYRHPDVLGRMHAVEGSWWAALPDDLAGRLDVVVSNPPYVSASEWEGLDPVVRDFEPRDALVSGPRGLEDLEELVRGAPPWLAPGGSLVLELAPPQGADVAALAVDVGFASPAVRVDLAGRPRALVARWPGD